MQAQLTAQSIRIDQILQSHKIAGRVTSGTVTPQIVRFKFSAPGVTTRQVSVLAEDIAAGLGVPSCRVFREEGVLQIEVPRQDRAILQLMDLCRRLAKEGPRGPDTVPPLTGVLGLDQEGVPLLLRLPSPNVQNVLIAGDPGTGKTSLARGIIASLALHTKQREMQVALIGEAFDGSTAKVAMELDKRGSHGRITPS